MFCFVLHARLWLVSHSLGRGGFCKGQLMVILSFLLFFRGKSHFYPPPAQSPAPLCGRVLGSGFTCGDAVSTEDVSRLELAPPRHDSTVNKCEPISVVILFFFYNTHCACPSLPRSLASVLSDLLMSCLVCDITFVCFLLCFVFLSSLAALFSLNQF